MIFCYKFRTFAEFWNFCLAKYRGRLIHGYSETCIFLAKKRVDLYTDSTYTPENTVILRHFQGEQFNKSLKQLKKEELQIF